MMSNADDRSRPYRSALRQRQAAETRRRVLEASAELFGRQGYQATTYAQIADEAGVSVETVQKQGPKSMLLQGAVELGSFGVEGESDVFATVFGQAILRVTAPDEFAALLAESMVAINAPSAGLWMTVVGAAQNDAELSELQVRLLAEIRTQVGRVLGFVAERGWLRTDVSFDDLVEAVCIFTSVETYARFIQLDRKSTEEYMAFVARMLRETVLTN